MPSPVSKITGTSPRKLFMWLLLTIFLMESITMMLVVEYVPKHSALVTTLIDASVLTLICTPFLWRLFLQPLHHALNLEGSKAHAIMEAAADAIITIDAKGIIQSCNEATVIMFGYPTEELIRQPITRLLPALERDQHQAHVLRYLAGGKPGVIGRNREFQAQRADGTVFPIDLTVSEVRTDGTHLFTGIIRDVSERQLAEQQLRQSKELLERIFSGNHAMLAYMDRNFNFLRVNVAYAAADGRTPDAYPGENHFALYPDAENEAIFREVVSTGVPHVVFGKAFEYPDHPERGVSYWDWSVHPVFDAEGQVDGILLTLINATDRHQAIQGQEISERNLRALIDATTGSAALIDSTGVVLTINETGARRFGCRVDEVIGKDIFSFMAPELAEIRRLRVRSVIESKQHQTFFDDRNGRQLRYALYPVTDVRNEVVRLAIYGEDITESVQQQAVEAVLNQFDQRVLRGDETSTLLSFVCQEVNRIFYVPFSWIGEHGDDGEITVLAGHGNSINEALDQESFYTAIRSGQAYLGEPDGANSIGVYCIPLILRGRIFGAFCLSNPEAVVFHSTSLAQHLQYIAQRISVALDMASDQQQLRLLSAALEYAGDGIFITDLEGRIRWGNAAFVRMSGYSLKEILGQNPRIFKSGKQDQHFYQRLWQTISAGNIWSEETTERNKSGHEYVVLQTITPIKDKRGQISHYISIHKDITQLKENEKHITFLAHHDTLTGLPNRALFYDRLGLHMRGSKRKREAMALLYLDLDRFKPINDRYGHDIGDKLLKQVSERLLGCVRESDSVARLGGDEFCLILPHIHHSEAACKVADKVISALCSPFNIDGYDIQIGTSIGIAFYTADGNTAEELVRKADGAMYLAKQQGNTYRLAGDD